MDVPFISSGATSRGHYALVRRVESADTPQLADQHLIAEVQSTRQRLAHPALTLVSGFSLMMLSDEPETLNLNRNNVKNVSLFFSTAQCLRHPIRSRLAILISRWRMLSIWLKLDELFRTRE